MNEDDARKAPGLVRSLKWARRVAGWCGILAVIDLTAMWVLLKATARTGQHGSSGLDATLNALLARCAVVGLVFVAIFFVSGVVAIVQQTRLRNVLQAAKGMLCPGCGYDLTGVEAGCCPECGRKYHGTTVASEWKDEYATALPPWSPLDTPADGGGGQDKDRT
jgi:hypothetical protein